MGSTVNMIECKTRNYLFKIGCYLLGIQGKISLLSALMPSLPDNHQLDTINRHCYDHCYYLWDRFPFPQTLPKWIKSYHCSSLGTSVLDIGSGTGQLAQWLQNQHFDVVCLDPSTSMLKQCQAKGLTTFQTTFQDYQTTSSFAIILAILSFIHIPKKEWPEQLNKIANLLPPKGLFIIACIEGEKEAIQETASGYPRFFAYCLYKEFIQLTQKQFELLDSCIYPAPQNSYLLFALRKR